MIPNALTACRGFVMRKLAGRFDAVRQLVTSDGHRIRVAHPSLLATVGTFVLMVMPAFLILALALGALLGHPESAFALATAPAITDSRVNLREMRDKRNTLLTEARSILEKATTEKRALNGEEEKRYDALFGEADGIGKTIQRSEKLQEEERAIAAGTRSPVDERDQRSADPMKELRELLPKYNLGDPDNEELREKFGEKMNFLTSPQARRNFRSFLRGVSKAPTADEIRRAQQEGRALSAGTDTAGGFTVAPFQFLGQLLKNVDDLTFVRDRATKFLVPSAASAGVPTLTADPADADWTAELAIGNEDSTMAFGSRELHPKPLAKYIKVSNKLLRSSLLDMESFVVSRLAYKFGISEERAYLSGTGANQPLGLFTASNDGIPTTRDVSTDNTATSITFDGLQNAKYALKPQYWRTAVWGFHRDGIKQIAKLKDGNGQYLWQPSKVAGEPDMLLSQPVFADEYIPNTFTTGQYVGILGAMENYWIVDALDMTLQRLVELFAATNQTGIIGRRELDGMPVLAEAFARVKLG